MACTLGLVAILLSAQHAQPDSTLARPSSTAQPRGSHPSPAKVRPSAGAPTARVRSAGATEPRTTAVAPATEANTTGASSLAASGASSPSAPTTTTGVGTAAFGPATISPSSASPAIQPIAFTGWLSGPDSVAATYPFEAGIGRTVVATWSGAPRLDLVVTCQGASANTTGGSGITARAPGGSCTVTLSGPADVATSTFEITVQP